MKLERFAVSAFALGAALFSTNAFAQTVGSASMASLRSCATTATTDPCDGEAPGQEIISRTYGGGIGLGGLNRLDVAPGIFAWSDVSLGALDMPVIRAATQSFGNVRMNINAFGFQSYIYTGPTGGRFSATGDLHIVNSSNNPAGGGMPNGAVYSQYVGVWDPSILTGLTTAEQLFTRLFTAPCSTAGVLGQSFVFGDLPGGETTITTTTTECSAGSLNLTTGQEILLVSGLQLPSNRGGYVDASSTYTLRLGQDLSAGEIANLQANLASATDRGASFGAVPEPATWLSMILGFGLVGSALRRRAVKAAHAL